MNVGGNPGGAYYGGGGSSSTIKFSQPAPVVRKFKQGKSENSITDRIKLETVLGLTVSSNATLDCNPKTEVVAYPAGCAVVLYNVRKNRQSHILNVSRKTVTCIAFSPDGRYLATGECGLAPAVRVWDLQDATATNAVQVAEFPGHSHGVSCVTFSTSSKHLVSVGTHHDMIVNVWNWRANVKLASNKVSSRVKAVSFSESGNYFVTVGFRHVKFWYLEYSRSPGIKDPVPLIGRSAILSDQKDNEFCDVVCGRGASADSTYAITRGGLLCEFNSRRLLDKWVELRTTSANCMAVGANYIFVGCAEGIVRCFNPETLQYITTMPRSHYLGVDVVKGTHISHMYNQKANARYPDVIAVTYDELNHKLTCVYNDHSIYIWDVRDVKRVGKSHSALYHSACIWGVEMVSDNLTDLPPGTFMTCSSDETVRLWNLDNAAHNIYSSELLKILYIDPELKFLKDVDLTAQTDRNKNYDEKIGVRCVRLSPDGSHIASGDRAGNIWVHHVVDGSLIVSLEAHDAEVLCLEYSPSQSPRLLASASRDRLIHVFEVDKKYTILQTLDDHSSSITAVRFLASSTGLLMVSCGADKTILFRQLVDTSSGYKFVRSYNVSGRTTLYDMEVDAGERHVLTACQDRNVRVYTSANGRHTKTFRGTTADEGTLIKVALDRSGIYLATSCTDKVLSVYDYYSTECMATMYGHSEIVTGLRFTPDCQHLISASGDGCIFVWRVPHDMVVTMKARLSQQALRQGKMGPGTNGLSGLDSETDSYTGTPLLMELDSKLAMPQLPDNTFNIGRLPSWAQKSLGNQNAQTESNSPEPPAKGKWAARIGPPEVRVDSDSKESSIDSGTDLRYVELKRERTVHKQVMLNANMTQLTDVRSRNHTDDSSLGSFKYEDPESTEHDGDVEDISDGERTSSSERGNRPTYYPENNHEDNLGEFMVNSIDVEELKLSQNRSKKWKVKDEKAEMPQIVVSASPQDSDEDEASTPSGDCAERNPLSCSNETIDAVGRRESFIKSAFDSLSGAETGGGGSAGKSLSSQHVRLPVSPRLEMPLRSPAKATPPETKRPREELQRRIQETRRQLEDVKMVYKSNLKSSQSTVDLSCGGSRSKNLSIFSSKPNQYGFATSDFLEENLDSLNSNYFDSLNQYQNNPLDPYDIPANINRYCTYENIKHNQNSGIGTVKNISDKPKQNYAFTVDFGKSIPIQSKVFDRLFKTEQTDKNSTKCKPKNFELSLNPSEDSIVKAKVSPRSIFKNYKSCPVSPVSEECKWADVAFKANQNLKRNEKPSIDIKKRNSLSFVIDLDSKYNQCNRNIVSTIKSDTEKMIAEITQKYGNLDEINHDSFDLRPSKKEADRDDGNFSSDSLEDCSLSQDLSCKNKLFSKRICRKHSRMKVMPKRSISDYEIYDSKKIVMGSKLDEVYAQKSSTLPRNMPFNLEDTIDEDHMNYYNSNMYRCQSVLTKRCVTRSNESVLSDNSNSSVSNEIFLKYGNEGGFQQTKLSNYFNDSQNNSSENIDEPFEKHRHSSASFFLNQKRYIEKSCSQDSIISDSMFDDNQLSRTNCNSLESILSDDSEYTKSAPLEMLFAGTRTKRRPIGNSNYNKGMTIPESVNSGYEFENTSKSYGSSPNNPSSFGMYMYNNYICESSSPHFKESYNKVFSPQISDLTVKHVQNCSPSQTTFYGFHIPANDPRSNTMTRSKSLYDSSTKPTSQPLAQNIAYYFDGNSVKQYVKDKPKADEIPRLEKSSYFVKCSKSLKPNCVDKDKYKSTMEGCEPNAMVKSKSCSFEVVLQPANKQAPPKSVIDRRSSHVRKNLEKFEEQIRKNTQNKCSKNRDQHHKIANSKITNVTKSLERGAGQKNDINKISMEFVPHKPPKPKRTSSVKLNHKKINNTDKSNFTTSISSNYRAKLDGLKTRKSISNINKEDINLNEFIDSDSERSFDVFIKEKDVNENGSETIIHNRKAKINKKEDRIKQISLESLDVLEYFAKDSIDYVNEFKKSDTKVKKEEINSGVKKSENHFTNPCDSSLHRPQTKENINPEFSKELQKYNMIERKIDIINKLVEMEERKILQEKLLKEWRMKPLRANFNDSKGVVKVLSRKFDKLAKNQTPTLTSITLEEVNTGQNKSVTKEIKRNRSLPDILDTDQICGYVANVDKDIIKNNSANPCVEVQCEVATAKLNNTVQIETQSRRLKTRVYNEMVIPKTDVHLDSENYESSTTSSSCTNSPKRFIMHGMNSHKNSLSGRIIRVLTPRLCMANKIIHPNDFGRPVLSCNNSVRSGISCQLARKAFINTPMLPSKYMPTSASRSQMPAYDYTDEETPGMRRAVSLSDLAVKPVPSHRTLQAASGTGPKMSGLRPATRHPKSDITKSSSLGMINQPSDSESDRGAKQGSRNLMRPTISSLNKVNAAVTRRRVGQHGYSSVTSTATQAESSSEPEEPPVSRKPAVPPRPRSVSCNMSKTGHSGVGGSVRDLSSKGKEPSLRSRSGARTKSTSHSKSYASLEQPMSSTQLCALTEQLTRTASKIADLYKQFKVEPAAATPDTGNSAQFINGLESAIFYTQQVLKAAVAGGGVHTNSSETLSSDDDCVNIEDSIQALDDNLCLDTSPDFVMSKVGECADKLLSVMQNKITNNQNTQSLPPNISPNNKS